MIETFPLTKRHRAVSAVDDLSLAAPDGKVTGFVGPDAPGKTSTMRMAVGLDRPTSGSATIDMRAHLRRSARRRRPQSRPAGR
ncbi:ATP-binding cassette domain-containing protein [Streptomyces sp. 3N207]|uniref:ATP-binding cassette domain-containing protein n=1 Tax=Streptomyces sp. 3N207 TaxID=3457417 RepID=UPI003FD2AB7A